MNIKAIIDEVISVSRKAFEFCEAVEASENARARIRDVSFELLKIQEAYAPAADVTSREAAKCANRIFELVDEITERITLGDHSARAVKQSLDELCRTAYNWSALKRPGLFTLLAKEGTVKTSSELNKRTLDCARALDIRRNALDTFGLIDKKEAELADRAGVASLEAELNKLRSERDALQDEIEYIINEYKCNAIGHAEAEEKILYFQKKIEACDGRINRCNALYFGNEAKLKSSLTELRRIFDAIKLRIDQPELLVEISKDIDFDLLRSYLNGAADSAVPLNAVNFEALRHKLFFFENMIKITDTAYHGNDDNPWRRSNKGAWEGQPATERSRLTSGNGGSSDT